MISIPADPAADPLYSRLSRRLLFLPHPPLSFLTAWKLLQGLAGRQAAKEYCSVASPWQRPWFLTSITQRAALLIHETKITG